MSLEIVIGPMFSGKSSYALSYIRRQHAIGKQVMVIKPDNDKRYSQDSVLVTHDKEKTPCMLWKVNQELEITTQMTTVDCIVIEEAQFFVGLTSIVRHLVQFYRKNIVVVGLDGDAYQRPFGEILNCIPWATTVTKLNALCCKCKDGTLAPYTRRISNHTGNQVDVGGSDKYESVCVKHLIHVG